MAEHYQLKCRECGKFWGNQARSFCDECLSPLEVVYDLEAIRPLFTRKNIEAGPTNLWRYSALLPLPEGLPRHDPGRLYAAGAGAPPGQDNSARAIST